MGLSLFCTQNIHEAWLVGMYVPRHQSSSAKNICKKIKKKGKKKKKRKKGKKEEKEKRKEVQKSNFIRVTDHE